MAESSASSSTSADYLYRSIFKYPVVHHDTLAIKFQRVEQLTHLCIRRIMADTLWVHANLVDVYGKILAGITRGRSYFTTENKKEKKKNSLMYSDKETEFIPIANRLLYDLATGINSTDPDLLLGSGLSNSVYEEVIHTVLSDTREFYQAILDMYTAACVASRSTKITDDLKYQEAVATVMYYEKRHNMPSEILYRLIRDLEFYLHQISALKTEIVKPYLRLVYSIARRKSRDGTQFYDNFQNGTLGLLYAISYFDHRRGLGFGPYAKWWIQQSMLLALKEEINIINLPNSTWQSHNYIEKIKNSIIDNGGVPSLSLLSKESGYTENQLRKLEDNVKVTQIQSLDYFIDDDNKVMLRNVIPQEETKESVDIVPYLSCLSAEDRRYVCLHFGLTEHLGESRIHPETQYRETLCQLAIATKEQ